MTLSSASIYVFCVLLSQLDPLVVDEQPVLLQFGVGLQRPQRVEPEEVVPDPELPEDAKEIVDRFQADASEIRRKAEKEISVRREAIIETLQKLQDKYTREAKLDEAVAIRDKLRLLRVAHLKPRPNPGTVFRFGNKIGKTFYFDVIGTRKGSVWGTDVYTSDSALAVAAVHAGILKAGQRGIVKVTLVESPDQHIGSVKNGVNTNNYGPFQFSFTVERPLPTDVDNSETDTNDIPEEPAVEFIRFGIPAF